MFENRDVDKMKKTLILFLCLFMLLLYSCDSGEQTSQTGETNTETQAEQHTTDANASLQTNTEDSEEAKIAEEEVTSLLSVYAEVLEERFGAECDFSSPAKSDDINMCFKVTNFQTSAEVKDYISNFVFLNLVDDSLIDEDFAEEDGELFLLRGGRGYGYYGIDPTVWEYTDNNSVKVLFCILGDPVAETYCTVNFDKDNGKWKVSGFVLPEGY